VLICVICGKRIFLCSSVASVRKSLQLIGLRSVVSDRECEAICVDLCYLRETYFSVLICGICEKKSTVNQSAVRSNWSRERGHLCSSALSAGHLFSVLFCGFSENRIALIRVICEKPTAASFSHSRSQKHQSHI
jgi:hypothetical protein